MQNVSQLGSVDDLLSEVLHYFETLLPLVLVSIHEGLQDFLPSELTDVQLEGNIFVIAVSKIALAEF
jgi:hypothetical protein